MKIDKRVHSFETFIKYYLPKYYKKKQQEKLDKELAKPYSELINAVESKHPNETRHQTALRYIKERESVVKSAAVKNRS